jgi:hypothetical protein
MKERASKRSVSPFGMLEAEHKPWEELTRLLKSHPAFQEKPFDDKALREIWEAPSGDNPLLPELCTLLLRHKADFESAGTALAVSAEMEKLFHHKVELFLMDHNGGVLFSKERDTLAGLYFAGMAEFNAGIFSEFVTRWIQSESMDTILHFFDFCLGFKSPTFEYYLLFAHPALARVLRNKAGLKALLDKAAPLLKKGATPEWEADVRRTLEI